MNSNVAFKTAIPATNWWYEMFDPEKQEYYYDAVACFVILNDPDDNMDKRNEYAVGQCIYPIAIDHDGLSDIIDVLGKHEKSITYTKVFYSNFVPNINCWTKDRFHIFKNCKD